MKNVKTVLAILLLAGVSVAVKAQTVNFTGNWKLNTELSEFGQVPTTAASQEIKISQKEDELNVSRQIIGTNGSKMTANENVVVDGKPTIGVIGEPKVTKTMILSWSEDGKVLKTETAYSKPGEPGVLNYKLQQEWSINAGGKLVVMFAAPTYKFKAVYDKIDGK